MKVTERIRAVCSCFCKPGTVRILQFHPFVVLHLPNQMNERVLQPDFRFLKARFAGKQCAQSRLVNSHCLTAAHSPLSPPQRRLYGIGNLTQETSCKRVRKFMYCKPIPYNRLCGGESTHPTLKQRQRFTDVAWQHP